MATITICRDDADMAAQAADFIIRASQEAIAARGRFTLAFTGGSSPKGAYGLLAQPERSEQIDWSKSFFFMGDDRFVDPDDENSNFGMVSKTLLEHVPVPEQNVYAMPVEAQNPAQGAELYQDTLREFFALPMSETAPPAIDLVLLGLGDDGHVASLFPGFPTLDITDAWVTSSHAGTLPPPIDRITLTFPTINAAREVLFLVNGASKAPVVHEILEGGAEKHKRPGVAVQPTDGTVTWLLTPDAASQLSAQ